MIYVIFQKYFLEKNEHKYHKEHYLGRRLLRYGLEKYYGISLSDNELEDRIDVNQYGKPFLKEYDSIHFNVSHCDGFVACALADCSVGLDVEIVQDFPESMIKKVLTEKEKTILRARGCNEKEYQETFFRFWTMKESYMKWEGKGFNLDPLSIEFLNFLESADGRAVVIQRMLDENCVSSVCFEKLKKEEIIYELYEEEMAGSCSKLSD